MPITPTEHRGGERLIFISLLFQTRLSKTGDDKMGGNRLGTARGGRNGECRRIVRGIANREHASRFRNTHKRSADDLRCPRRTSDNSVRKLRSVQGQHQLSRLCDRHVEEHLIGAGRVQENFGRAQAPDVRVCDHTVSRKGNIRSGGNGGGIVGRHQRIEVRIAQHTARRSLRSLRACGACGTRRARGTDLALRSLRTCGALRSCGSLRSCGTLRSLRSLRTDRSLRTRGSDGADGALCALRSRFTDGSLGSDGSLRSCGTCGTCGAAKSLGTGLPCRTLRTDRPLQSRRAVQASIALLVTSGALSAAAASPSLRAVAVYSKRILSVHKNSSF